jgi:hypothetical protein
MPAPTYLVAPTLSTTFLLPQHCFTSNASLLQLSSAAMRFFMMLGMIVPSLGLALPGSPTVRANQVDKLEDRQVRQA